MEEGSLPHLLVFKPSELRHLRVQLDLIDYLILVTDALKIFDDFWTCRMMG